MAMVGPRFEFQGVTVKENDNEYVPTIHVWNSSEIPATTYYLIGTIFVSDYKKDDQNKDVSGAMDKVEDKLKNVTLRDNDQVQITRGMGIELSLLPIGKKQKELVDESNKQVFVVWAATYRRDQQVKDTMWVTELCAQITKPFTGFQSCPAHNRYFLADQALKKLN